MGLCVINVVHRGFLHVRFHTMVVAVILHLLMSNRLKKMQYLNHEPHFFRDETLSSKRKIPRKLLSLVQSFFTSIKTCSSNLPLYCNAIAINLVFFHSFPSDANLKRFV